MKDRTDTPLKMWSTTVVGRRGHGERWWSTTDTHDTKMWVGRGHGERWWSTTDTHDTKMWVGRGHSERWWSTTDTHTKMWVGRDTVKDGGLQQIHTY